MFIGIANFYWHFIQDFSKIAISLTFLLKLIGLSEFAPKVFKTNDNKVFDCDSNRANRTIINLSKNEKSKKLMHVLNIGAMKEPNFLIPNAKKVFNYL